MSAHPINYAAIDDGELARLVSLRDASAIRIVTARNNQRLFRCAWSVLRNDADAEDAVQEAYLKAFRSIDRFNALSSLSTWLTRIVLNTALDRKRANQRQRAAFDAQDIVLMENYRSTHASFAASPEAELARAELGKYLKAAIADLPEAYRIIFILREIEGMSVAQTAQAAAINEATVKTRLFRARGLLRKALEPEFENLFGDIITFAGTDCEAMTLRVLNALDPNR